MDLHSVTATAFVSARHETIKGGLTLRCEFLVIAP